MRQFHFFCKQRYLKYTVLSLLLCPLSSSAAEEWKDVKGESTTKIVESTQQKKQKRTEWLWSKGILILNTILAGIAAISSLLALLKP